MLRLYFLMFFMWGGVAIGSQILFVRGADRSGGFLEANNDQERTEQLADINNFSTSSRNHGWGELGLLLRSKGFETDQVAEPLEMNAPLSGQTQGAPLDFSSLPNGRAISDYDIIVFGSNNAVYPESQIDLVEAFVRSGGGVLFISDANFGSDWGDAPASDQQFLDRFGLEVLQDRGTYSLDRSSGEFLEADHPLLLSVDSLDGEGVSPFRIGAPAAGVDPLILANAEGSVRNNDSLGAGSTRASDQGDASLIAATVDGGRVVGHFDRNTFFNQNGAGTNINRLDNSIYAENIFGWLDLGEPVPEPSAIFLLGLSVIIACFVTRSRP